MMTTHSSIFDGDLQASTPNPLALGFSLEDPVAGLVATCVQTEFGAWFSGANASQRLVQSVLARLK